MPVETRNMNARLKFFNFESGQNNDGEIIKKSTKKEHFKCWSEVNKATMKEFKERVGTLDKGNLQKRRDTLVFGIRYQQKLEVLSTMMVEYKGKDYSIIDMEPDFKRKDMQLIKVQAVV